MDLSRARVALRQRSVLDVLDLTLRFVVAHGRAYTRQLALVVLPAALVSWGVARALGWLWGWAVAIVLAGLAQPSFTVLASRLVFEPAARPGAVLRATMQVLPRVVLLQSLRLLLVGLGLFFFVIPGLWGAAALLVLTDVAVLEGEGAIDALTRAWHLASARSGEALVATLALSALWIGAALLGDAVGRAVVSDLLQFREPEALWSAGGSVLALAGFWAFLPYVATARFFVYLDLRTRNEGWDIQTRFAALRARDLRHRDASLRPTTAGEEAA